MPRFRQQMAKRPIHSIKHVVDDQGGIVIDTKTFVQLIHAVDAPVLANRDETEVGSRVNAIFLNVQVAASSTAALANIYMYLYGNPGNNIGVASVPKGNVTGSSDFKKMIFHTEMIMTEKNTTAIPRTLFKGVITIPRKFRRQGIDDTINLLLYSPGVTWDYCVQCIYKEYR